MLSVVLRGSAPQHYNNIQTALLNAVLTERFPDDSFYTVSVDCAWKRSLANYYSKPGIVFAVLHKCNLKILIKYAFCTNDMAKAV